MRKVVSLDLDNTLVNIMTPWINYGNQKDGTKYSIDDIDHYSHPFLMKHFDYIETPFFDNISPIDGAIEFVRELQSDYDVQIVTHTFEGHRESKLNFIKNHFGDLKVITTGSCKLDSIEGTFHVDDHLNHIESHTSRGGHGVVYSFNDRLRYNIPHKNSGIVRLGNYPKILEHIRRHW